MNLSKAKGSSWQIKNKYLAFKTFPRSHFACLRSEFRIQQELPKQELLKTTEQDNLDNCHY